MSSTTLDSQRILYNALIGIFSDIQSASHSAKFQHLISIYSLQDIYTELMRIIDEDAMVRYQRRLATNGPAQDISNFPCASIPNITEHIFILLRELFQNYSHLIHLTSIPQYLEELLRKMNHLVNEMRDAKENNGDELSPTSAAQLRHAQKLLRRATMCSVQLLALYQSQAPHERHIPNLTYSFFETLRTECFAQLPNLTLYFLEHTFSLISMQLNEKQLESLLVASLQEFHPESLSFLTFLIEQLVEEENMDSTCAPLVTLVHNSIRYLNDLLRSKKGRDFFVMVSEEFMHQLMQLLNEYAPLVCDEQHVEMIFQLLLDILARDKDIVHIRQTSSHAYPSTVHSEILNTLLVNYIPCHSDYAEREGYLRDALQLCLEFMSDNGFGSESGSEMLKELSPHLSASAFTVLLTLTKENILSSHTSISTKNSALTMLGIAVAFSDLTLHRHSSSLLQILHPPLTNDFSANLKRNALLTLCRCIRVVRKDLQRDLQPILDIMLSGLVSSNPPDDTLQMSILKAISTLELKNYGCPTIATHQVALHLIRCFQDASSVPRVQYEAIQCLAEIISNSTPNKEWDSAFDQILSFLLKIMQSCDQTKYSNLIKKTATESIGYMCRHAKRTTTFAKYLPDTMEQYMQLLMSNPESELVESIFSFISDVSHILKSNMTQYLRPIFTIVTETLKISAEERVAMKKLKHSGGHTRSSQERHAAMEVVDSLLQNVSYPKVRNFLPNLIDALVDLNRLSSMHTHNDLLLMDTIKCVSRIYHIVRENPQQISGGKRRKTSPSDQSPLPWKRRRVETSEGGTMTECIYSEQMSSEEDAQYSVTRINNKEKSLVAILRVLNGILALPSLSAEVKMCALQHLQSASVYLVKELSEERRRDIFQSLHQLISSRRISQYAVHEQVSLTAKLVEICQQLQIQGIEDVLKKSSVDVVTAYMMQKMQNPSMRRSSHHLYGGFSDFESNYDGDDIGDAFDLFEVRKEEVELIHRFTMNC